VTCSFFIDGVVNLLVCVTNKLP